MATIVQAGTGTGLVANYALTRTQTAEAGGPGTAATDVTPVPLGDINDLPRDGQSSTLPLDNGAPTAPTVPPTPGSSTPPTAGGGTVDEPHRSWSSIGDPHVTMGNERFDNTRVGEFVLMESQDKSFQVQARQDRFGDGSVANTAAAVKDGDNVVTYDVKDKKLMVNGKEWDGQTQPPGMKIEKTGDGYAVTSSKGDVTNIHDKGHYLDLDGKIGPERQVGEVKGAHGVFDNVDTAESHVKRDGSKATGIDDMIDSWKVGQGESLFNKANAGGPAAADSGQTPAPLDPAGGAGTGNGPAPAPANNANPADPANSANPAAPANPANPAGPAAPNGPDGKGGPVVTDDIKKALQDILTQLKDLIANLTKIMEKLGIKVDAPAAGGPAADPKAADPKAADAGKGGPAAAPATFEDQKKAEATNDVAPKTFADQKKEDEAKAAAAAAGKGGPTADAKAADAKAADAKAAEVKAADAKAAEVKAGGPTPAADPLQEILNQLKELIKGLTALLEKLGAAQGAAPQAAAANAKAA